ncbi:diacylglycerol/lipid kinase family protein [Leucobacter tenebrionis]|uniref:diacylglycerol/lipid kinase family protein n=1 Tax=Leucobacter tenebrionis TaxID=2873270 RepID=UPI001CA6CFE3|nr:diacylglycerol kinase family protein [Leucobacter tenebrionis]QZY53168.1 diacylglycerol kinase [Leucobacter tenebrionis]
MNEKVGIVWNPSKVEGEELREAFERALEGAFAADRDRPECQWFETTEEDPGQGAASAAIDAGCGLVIAAGGDGTVRAVAERLGESGSPAADLGIVPLGTGNLLARNLGVPLGDARAAFERALTGSGSPLDLGEVVITRAPAGEGESGPDAAGTGESEEPGGSGDPAATAADSAGSERHGFVVMVGFGIDAQMIVETDDELKAKTGWLAYVESLGRAATGTEVVELSLQLDDDAPITESAHTVLVANCGSIQGGITLLPDAAPDDGELDLLVLRADDAGAWLDTMRNMVWDNGLKRLITGGDKAESSGSTAHLRARTVRAELPVPLAFEVDGDDVGSVSAFEVRILPAALRVR